MVHLTFKVRVLKAIATVLKELCHEKNVCVQAIFFSDIFIGMTVFGSLVPN